MPACVISEVTVLDEERAHAYRELTTASVALHDGRFSRGGRLPWRSRATGRATPS